VLSRLLPYTTVLTVLVAVWTGWKLYTRYQDASAVADLERQAKQKQVDMDRKVVDAYGGDELKIMGFTAAKGEVAAGDPVVLCYGVSNAAKVKIEPNVEPIKPALTHCLEVLPKRTTTYTLKAEDAKGNTKSVSLTVKVR